MNNQAQLTVDLSIIIPSPNESSNLAIALPIINKALAKLKIRYEILIITDHTDDQTLSIADKFNGIVKERKEAGYGAAIVTGFTEARGDYFLTMDADLSNSPALINDLWAYRSTAEIIIASRYIPGGRAMMTGGRYFLSRLLNSFFSRGLSLVIKDMSSGFRLYKASAVRGQKYTAHDFDILQEILVRAYAEGWHVREIPFSFAPRKYGSSHVQVIRFGLAYLKTFRSLWKLRNSILAADYDSRAYDSIIFLQRYWQRSRYRHIVELITGEGAVLDVGCGSSRIIGALRPDSVAVDILFRKLRYARRFSRQLIHGSGFYLPFENGAFPCVLCSQVIEHVPKESPILDELERVLAPGGRLVLGTPDYDHWEWVYMEKLYGKFAPGGYADEHIAHYSYKELVERFEKKGFCLEETRYILRGEMILAFRKASK
jgi:dolichol-phosphate mannosyltransferase